MNEPLAARSSLLESGRLIYAFLGLLILALWLPRLHGPIDLRWDGGAYFVLGTSIAEGKGYRLLNEPGEIRANQYPPLFPLLIAAHQTILGTTDPLVVGRALRLMSFLAFTIYVFAVFALLRRHLASLYALFGTVVCLLNVHTYFLSDLCFPDLLYAVMAVGFLLAFSGGSRCSMAPLAGAFAVAGFALRTTGLALITTWVGEALLKKEWRTALGRAACALIPLAAWFSYVHDVETSAEYNNPAYAYQRADYMFYNVSYAKNVSLNDPFEPDLGYATMSDRAERYLRNVLRVTRYLGESVSAMKRAWEREREQLAKRWGIDLGPPWIIDVPLYALGCAVLAGMGVLLARGELAIPLCAFSSIMVICLTPWPEQFNRYLMPTVPFLSLSLCASMVWVTDRSRQASTGIRKCLGVGLVSIVIAGIGLQQTVTTAAVYLKRHLPVQYKTRQGETVKYHLFFYMDSYRALDAGMDWLILQAKSTAIIASSMPHWVYLRTGNKTVMPPFESDPIRAEQFLESVPVTYLILDEGLAIDSKRFMKRVIETFPDRWKRLYSDSVVTETGERHDQAFEIYERVQPTSTTMNPGAVSAPYLSPQAFSEKEPREVG